MQSGKWESHHYLYNKNVSQTIPGDWRGRGALAGGADLVRRLAGCPAGVKLTLYVFSIYLPILAAVVRSLLVAQYYAGLRDVFTRLPYRIPLPHPGPPSQTSDVLFFPLVMDVTVN